METSKKLAKKCVRGLTNLNSSCFDLFIYKISIIFMEHISSNIIVKFIFLLLFFFIKNGRKRKKKILKEKRSEKKLVKK